ncbi:HIT-like protein [Moorella thermoacetica]|uniref:HIT-like protein n=1 Tax=Neomoorella thermoacetica TaxID=1525 RepID=A0A1D7X8L2_NEOTH|nr:HIT-like protein [Moorella thermoacetica]AKX95986.1 HIT-like protein [Moorella thermoacetica]AOQ23253.1 HIT-like protein [Moorella thermoacetica]OIQ12040.1 HIT-like protein [Moorella thermoacetica]OIQ56071.1 HIT-like protein [Moorella thermoacetica]
MAGEGELNIPGENKREKPGNGTPGNHERSKGRVAEDCIFCQIAAGKIPSEVVYQDDRVVAFKDIRPVAPVHILIIPRKHIPDLTAITPEDGDLIGYIHLVAVKLAREFGLADRGFRVVNNCKEEGGQAVYHLHFHLLGGRQLQILG